MRIVVIGLGRRMSYVLEHLQKAVSDDGGMLQILGYYDISERCSKQLGFDIGERYADISEMIETEKPDAVFVGSPNASHFKHLQTALKYPVKIFTEKPVVRTMDESHALRALLANVKNEDVIVGFPLRSAPVYRAAQEYLPKLGQIKAIKAQEFLHPSHGHYIGVEDWRRYQKYAGSFLLDKTVHDFDLMLQMIKSPVCKVESTGAADIFTNDNIDYLKEIDEKYDAFSAEIAGMRSKMSNWQASDNQYVSDGDIRHRQHVICTCKNGAVIDFEASLLSQKITPVRRMEIVAENGQMVMDFVANILRVTGDKFEEAKVTFEPCLKTHYGADPEMARDIVQTFVHGKPYPSKILDGLTAGEVVMYADEACDNGKQLVIGE